MDIDPKKLLYFATVIEQGSINRAAKLLEVSQPALSTSMDRLEEEVGLQLIQRGPKGIVTTKSGDILYCHARLIREELRLAERDLLNSLDDHTCSIKIGSLPSLASKIIPMALSKWRESHREGHLQIIENAQVDLLIGLLRRDFDFVIGYTEVFDMLDGLRQRVLFRDTLCVIAGPNHPLRSCKTLSWKDLMQYPWISPTSRRTHTVLERIAQTMNLPHPDQITVCGSVSLLKSLVSETDHLALLPAHAVREEIAEQRLFSLPFRDSRLRRDIAVFFREGYDMDQPRKDLVECVAEIGLELCRVRSEDTPAPEVLVIKSAAKSL
jgi:DNA-binding transcriptional LysR family regulator